MYRIIGMLLLVTLLNGCSSVSGKYAAIENGDYFSLPETYTESGKQGLFGDFEYVRGLSKGRYIAVGRDENGTYYRGPSYCMILLLQDLALQYRKDGRIPTLKEKFEKMGGLLPGVEGGVYVPFDKAKEKPRYYYYQDFRPLTGEQVSGIPPSPADSLPPSDVASAVETNSQNEAAMTRMALDIASRSTGSPSNVTANAVGAAAGLSVGNALGKAGMRGMQGTIIFDAAVQDPHILEAITQIRPRAS